MSWNKNDRKEFEKFAQTKGYNWNSDGTKLINGSGKTASFSGSGGSGYVGNTHYNSLSDAKKSKKW